MPVVIFPSGTMENAPVSGSIRLMALRRVRGREDPSLSPGKFVKIVVGICMEVGGTGIVVS